MKRYDQTNEYKYSLFYESQASMDTLTLFQIFLPYKTLDNISLIMFVFLQKIPADCVKTQTFQQAGNIVMQCFHFIAFFLTGLESVIALCSYFEFS